MWDGGHVYLYHLFPEQVWRFLSWRSNECPEIVMESFQYRQGLAKADLTPVEVIGVVKEFCRQEGLDLSLQSPAQGKFYWTDSKLKDSGLWVAGAKHAMDALKHLLTFRKIF